MDQRTTAAAGTAGEPVSVIGCVAAVAGRHPDAPALHDADGTTTFAELLRAALRLAAVLADLPPGPVGLVVPSRAATVVAQVGIAASGRASVPLDPTYPAAGLADVLAVSGAVAIVAPPDLEAIAAGVADGRPVVPWVPATGPAGVDEELVVPDVAADEDLTIYFTSGSTGGPKGVVHTQRNWVDAGLGFAAAGLSGPGRRYLLMSPMGFAAAGIITSFALFGGSALSIYDARALGLSDLPAWIRDHDITTVVSIPSAVRAVIAATGGEPLPKVDHVIYGGEMVTHADIRSARSLSDAVDTTLLYVTTELGVITSRTITAAEPMPAEEPVHCGEPFVGRSIRALRIVGEAGKTCAEGEAGAIEATSDRLSWFIGEDRAAPDDPGLMVGATGDMGRLLEGGGLQLLGRADQLVKIRGYRIDQAEVERQMRELPAVADVAVVVGMTGRGTPQLVAHVVAVPGDPTTADDLRDALREVMPAYMIPARIFLADALPRLRNGKVDRVTLKLAAKPAEGDRAGVIGRRLSTPAEKAVAEAFATVLGVDEVGADDDFFDLGGSSLEVAELLVRLQDALGVPVPASLLTHHSTPEQLAGAVERLGRDRSSVVTIQGARSSRRPTVHLVYDLHGSPFRMRDLAAALGSDQPVDGFECPLIFGEPGAPTTFPDIAARHVADLVAAQPSGPYHLVGYSVGSALMFEMAGQLAAAGHEVGFLGAVDFGPVYLQGSIPRRDGPKPPGTYPVRAPATARGLARARFHRDLLAGRSRFEQVAHLSRLARVGREHDLALARLDLARHGRVRPELRSSWAWYSLLGAAQSWEIHQAPVDVTLFLCDQTAQGNISVSRRIDHASRTEPTLGWSAWARSVDVRPVVGSHNSLVEEPYVGGVGSAIRAALDEWLAR